MCLKNGFAAGSIFLGGGFKKTGTTVFPHFGHQSIPSYLKINAVKIINSFKKII